MDHTTEEGSGISYLGEPAVGYDRRTVHGRRRNLRRRVFRQKSGKKLFSDFILYDRSINFSVVS